MQSETKQSDESPAGHSGGPVTIAPGARLVGCQNCKKDFTIEPDDFAFYEKMKVPPPTWCPECRLVRRFLRRNERFLYKRRCGLCDGDIITVYHADDPYIVYCHDCWFGDKWDSLSYGKDYDFSRPFFAQWQELRDSVPRFDRWLVDAVDSPYANMVRGAKNAHLSYSLVGMSAENIFYSKGADTSSNVFDCLSVVDCELCYENVNSARNTNCHYCVESRDCLDSWFLFDCRNCQDCALSTNLRNKKYVFENVQYNKNEYNKLLSDLNLAGYSARELARYKFEKLILAAVHKYADIIKANNSSGNYIANTKHAVSCFNAYNAENIKYCQRVVEFKDAYDASYNIQAELIYEYIIGGNHSRMLRFGAECIDAVNDSHYADQCGSSSNLFGCVGLRNKEYCILNKQYTEEEYEELVPKIIAHMNEMPYVDKKGRVYKYGEFFPPELSPFGYNETIAQEHFPLTKEKAEESGYRWRQRERAQYEPTISCENLPDNISQVQDSMTKEIISCQHYERDQHAAGCKATCTAAFRIAPFELQFYRSKGTPIPRICPNCRHFERLQKITPFKLWDRVCSRCGKNIKTPYAPDRPEIIYCEQCYNQEVA